jgi:outer membrane protease
MNWKAAGMTGTALLTIALSGVGAVAGANKFSGNISLGVGQTFQDDTWLAPFATYDDSFASLHGEAKLNVAFSSNINLQVDLSGVASFADASNPVADLDRDAGVQAAAHLYYRTGAFAAGVVGGVGVASGVIGSPEYYFVGAEGQYYWNEFTFGLNAGYLDSSADLGAGPDDAFLNSAWYVGGEVRYYANEKTTFSANLGYIEGEASFGDYDIEVLHWGAKVEYRPDVKEPLSLWVAYEGRTSDATETFVASPESFDRETHTIKVGVTFSFGVDGSKMEQDRSGPAFNQMDYGAIVVGG